MKGTDRYHVDDVRCRVADREWPVSDLSVGGFYKDGIPTHHILLGAEVWIIEGLDFSKVKPGHYELLCLPIKFDKGDGAPARCLIRPI